MNALYWGMGVLVGLTALAGLAVWCVRDTDGFGFSGNGEPSKKKRETLPGFSIKRKYTQ